MSSFLALQAAKKLRRTQMKPKRTSKQEYFLKITINNG